MTLVLPIAMQHVDRNLKGTRGTFCDCWQSKVEIELLQKIEFKVLICPNWVLRIDYIGNTTNVWRIKGWES